MKPKSNFNYKSCFIINFIKELIFMALLPVVSLGLLGQLQPAPLPLLYKVLMT